MYPISEGLQLVLDSDTYRLSTCWIVERTDGTIMYFTDHDSILTVDGTDYSPAGGFNPSARQAKTGLNESNMEFVGLIDSSQILISDLRAGKYRNAKITEFCVDWQFVDQGKFFTRVYWIDSVSYTGEQWTAELIGLAGWLRAKAGDLYTRSCRYQVGDERCGRDLVNYYHTDGTVTSVQSLFQQWTCNLGTVTPQVGSLLIDTISGYHTDGKLLWLTGNNAGTVCKVGNHVASGSSSGISLTLYLPLPFGITVGDTFTVWAGCNQLITTCTTRFVNLPKFGGYPFIPGTDNYLRTPNN